MSLKVRSVVALVAGVGALGLLLQVRGGVGATGPWPALLVVCSGLLLLVILYGQGTSCPACARWWVRTEVQTEFVDREVFDKGGVPFGRSHYRTTYACRCCRHQWSMEHAEEYREPVRARARKSRE
jgi:hypothetical protein